LIAREVDAGELVVQLVYRPPQIGVSSGGDERVNAPALLKTNL
jgi:hypothetical protein